MAEKKFILDVKIKLSETPIKLEIDMEKLVEEINKVTGEALVQAIKQAEIAIAEVVSLTEIK